jgi:hypothetical protein
MLSPLGVQNTKYGRLECTTGPAKYESFPAAEGPVSVRGPTAPSTRFDARSRACRDAAADDAATKHPASTTNTPTTQALHRHGIRSTTTPFGTRPAPLIRLCALQRMRPSEVPQQITDLRQPARRSDGHAGHAKAQIYTRAHTASIPQMREALDPPLLDPESVLRVQRRCRKRWIKTKGGGAEGF